MVSCLVLAMTLYTHGWRIKPIYHIKVQALYHICVYKSVHKSKKMVGKTLNSYHLAHSCFFLSLLHVFLVSYLLLFSLIFKMIGWQKYQPQLLIILYITFVYICWMILMSSFTLYSVLTKKLLNFT